MFLLHHGLNAEWYGSLRRGKWTGIHATQTVIDGLLLVDMLALMVSGVTMSRHVFGFLRLGAWIWHAAAGVFRKNWRIPRMPLPFLFKRFDFF